MLFHVHSKSCRWVVPAVLLAALTGAHAGEAKVVWERHENDAAAPDFRFEKVPAPLQNDAATVAKFSLIEGEQDANGASLDALHDGRLPAQEDEPAANFFFRARSGGGRILIDLGRAVDVAAIRSYSWHPANRGPQVYNVYAAAGGSAPLNLAPKKPLAPEQCGWRLLAKVDTRADKEGEGGQFAVGISSAEGPLGQYQHLLLEVLPTHASDPFAQTFFSEIDVVDAKASEPPKPVEVARAEGRRQVVKTPDGAYEFIIDATETPDLQEWIDKSVVPMATNWYPKLVQMLSSSGYEAPPRITIAFSANMNGVAETGGTRVRCAARWFRANLQGEALGAVFHELVHVVQQYGRARRTNPNPKPSPGWLVEGLADYVRWYRFEPESRGAEIHPRNIARARYDSGYRVTANFLNWASEKYDKTLAEKLNAAMREAKYESAMWQEWTGHSLADVGAEWKSSLEQKSSAPEANNQPN